MYSKILVALENSAADQALVPHVAQLAKQLHSRLLLVHVADGWVARNYELLKLKESDEMVSDRDYLNRIAAELRVEGLSVDTLLALGDPPAEIIRAAEEQHCDLIAMAAHGHRLVGDLLHGSTIREVRHNTRIPVLTIRASPPAK